MAYFELHPIDPFRLDLTVWVLRRQAHNAMDVWNRGTYLRTWHYRGGLLTLRLWQSHGPSDPVLEGEIYEGPDDADAIAWAGARLNWILGLDRDRSSLYNALIVKDAGLAPLMDRYHGFSPPRFDSLYEGLINAVACQQLSLSVGITLLNRLCRLCAGDTGSTRSILPFPTPQRLLEQDPALLRDIGFSHPKIRSLRAVAQAALDGELNERVWHTQARDLIETRLVQLPGIGRWSAEYVLLRALGHLDVFPGDDVGGRKGLLHWLGAHATAVGYEDTLAHLKPWAPYGGMIYFFMLLRRLEQEGHIAIDKEKHPSDNTATDDVGACP